ncbi:uncharacterized protein LOC142321171 [Lycorma delicatula]|uniref:uncharacterized protein LOC142321171 n=1 Tax=Lycorma delicatula TaxID=130591 RepID=UPI003F50E38F
MSNAGLEDCTTLEPPSGFSDSHELSEAECDRHNNVFSNAEQQQLEEELYLLVKKYHSEKYSEEDYIIHV